MTLLRDGIPAVSKRSGRRNPTTSERLFVRLDHRDSAGENRAKQIAQNSNAALEPKSWTKKKIKSKRRRQTKKQPKHRKSGPPPICACWSTAIALTQPEFRRRSPLAPTSMSKERTTGWTS